VRPTGDRWRCGQQASFALADRIGRATVRCEQRDTDRYGRVVAVCFKGGEELNRWMVANGWAVAFRRYSLDYVAEEDTAQRNRTNIWSGAFDMPWDWRGQNRNRSRSP
jgi:endonuclease YncB( thermonuclease family)